MRHIPCVVFALSLLACTASYATMPVAVVTGKLVDRQCSVVDDFNLQPATERRCTLWIKELTPDANGIFRVWTIYCPNKAADGQAVANNAFGTCSDPYGLQVNHPSHIYTITGWLRTAGQQADGYGQVQGFQFHVS